MQVVAEIGAGHNRKLENVFRIIEETYHASAFKIQTWSQDTMAAPGRKIKDGLWAGRELTKLYQKAHLPWEWHSEIFDYCRRKEVMLYSTPFDMASVDFLERLVCPAYKVASFEACDLQLVQYIAQTGKPIVVSCGQLYDHEVDKVVETIVKYNSKLMLLHCVSEYPTPIEDANLTRMLDLKQYGFPVGLSDHSPGAVLPIAATGMGASMIEKHVTLNEHGLDGSFAMRPHQFNTMAEEVKQASQALNPQPAPDMTLRRSLYWATDVKAGTKVARGDLKTMRPNLGMSPIEIEKILGSKLTEDVFRDQPVLQDQLARS